MPIVTNGSNAEEVFVHQLTDEGFRFRGKWLLPRWTIDSGNADGDDFGFVPDRDFITTANADHKSMKFRLSPSREAG